MTIELVEAFVKLVEHKSFVRAAESLYISQSSLSHRILQLESELNTQLIVRARGKRTFELTSAGTDFISIAERWMVLAQDTANFKVDRRAPTLTVASIETISFILSPLYRKITFSPEVRAPLSLETHTYSSPQIINEVENQNVDIGFTVRQRSSKSLRIVPILREKHYLLANIDSEKSEFDPCTLDPRKEIITDWSPDYQAWHDACLGSNAHPLATIDTATQLSFFMLDGAWCVVPESAVQFLRKNCQLNGLTIRAFQMPAPPPDRICYKVTNRSPRLNRAESISHFETELMHYLNHEYYHNKDSITGVTNEQ